MGRRILSTQLEAGFNDGSTIDRADRRWCMTRWDAVSALSDTEQVAQTPRTSRERTHHVQNYCPRIHCYRAAHCDASHLAHRRASQNQSRHLMWAKGHSVARRNRCKALEQFRRASGRNPSNSPPTWHVHHGAFWMRSSASSAHGENATSTCHSGQRRAVDRLPIGGRRGGDPQGPLRRPLQAFDMSILAMESRNMLPKETCSPSYFNEWTLAPIPAWQSVPLLAALQVFGFGGKCGANFNEK